jgi:hypothetical protein
MTGLIIALLVVCGGVDWVTTLKGLRGGATEANPAASAVFRLFGTARGVLLLKVACTGIICGVLLLRPQWWPLGIAFLAGYAFVVTNNLRVLAAQRRRP